MFFRRNRQTPAAAAPAPIPAASVTPEWMPAPPPSDSISIIDRATLAGEIGGRPVVDVVLEYFEAYEAGRKGSQQRLSDLMGYTPGIVELRLMVIHCAANRSIMAVSPKMSRARFQALLDDIAAGRVRYVDDRYADDTPQYIEAVDGSARWTLEEWGDAK